MNATSSSKSQSLNLSAIKPWWALVLIGLSQEGIAIPVCWDATGHCYERVDVSGGITWYDAKLAAEANNGHLATVTSQEENDFIVNNLGGLYGYWLGGFQPAGSDEPAAGWQWVTGEAFSYTNWSGGEPNNGYGQDYGELPGVTDEDGVVFWGNGAEWNDLPRAAYLVPGYILEIPGTQFSTFTPRAELKLGPKADDDSYWLRGYMKLADTSNGINPLTEAVTIKFGSFSHTITVGSFVQQGSAYFFKGQVGPSTLDVKISPLDNPRTYWFKSCLKSGDLEATTMKPQAQLTIGDDTGQTALDVGQAKFGKGKDGEKWLGARNERK